MKISYWLRTDIQHFAHIQHIYDSLGGMILTKNPVIFDYLKENFPYLCSDLYLVKNSSKARKLLFTNKIKIVVYTGFQLIFWGYSIQVFHGASDKKYLLEDRKILLYDLLLLPGEKHMDKIRSAYNLRNPERFKIVGYPKFDKLVLNTLDHKPLFTNGKQTILYAPTWISQGSGTKLAFSPFGESSLPLWGVSLIRALTPKFNLIIKYHSRINKNCTEIYSQIDNYVAEHDLGNSVRTVWDSNITKYMQQADLMISDISAVCYEWFHTNRPIVFANPSPENYQPSTDTHSNTYSWQAGDVLYGKDEIAEVVERNLTTDKYREIRNQLLNHSFFKPDGHATERQTAEIRMLYNRIENKNRFQLMLHGLYIFARSIFNKR